MLHCSLTLNFNCQGWLNEWVAVGGVNVMLMLTSVSELRMSIIMIGIMNYFIIDYAVNVIRIKFLTIVLSSVLV